MIRFLEGFILVCDPFMIGKWAGAICASILIVAPSILTVMGLVVVILKLVDGK